MHDRPAGARPPRPQFVRLPSPHSATAAAAAGRPSPCPCSSARPAAHSRGQMATGSFLLLVSTACGAHLHPSSFVPLRASSVLVYDGPAPPPGPRLFACLGSRPLPYYLTSTPTPAVCLVLDALDVDSISSFHGSFILL
ncbi:hypothetical protein V8C34DRAFT_122269 [Trichoderma compactum]